MEPQTVTVAYQVISSDYTKADKLKRWGRALKSKANNFYQQAKAKTVDLFGKAKEAIAAFFDKLYKTSKATYSEVTSIINDIKEDWEGGDTMGLFSQLGDFLLGPPQGVQQSAGTGNYTEFTSHNTSEQMMSAITAQNGFVSEEQLEQFVEIGTGIEANAKRLHQALEIIKKSSGTETAGTKEIFQVLNLLEQNAYKRSEYQAKRRQDSQILQEKFKGLRDKL